MILLYAASTSYHSLNISPRINKILKKVDHMMISVMIAGSYTPVCLIVLKGRTGYTLCALVWGIAILGILVKAFWINCPKWFSSALYIGMGWLCVLAFTQIINSLSPSAFGWLLAGGLIYTVGGVIYALKLPLFNSRHKYFGSHEIFHLFVMGNRYTYRPLHRYVCLYRGDAAVKSGDAAVKSGDAAKKAPGWQKAYSLLCRPGVFLPAARCILQVRARHVQVWRNGCAAASPTVFSPFPFRFLPFFTCRNNSAKQNRCCLSAVFSPFWSAP